MMKLLAMYPFQETAAKAVERKKRVGFLVYYGGGKTYLSLRWLEELGAEALPCLVLCPKTAIVQWGTEIEKFTAFTYSLIEGTPTQRVKAIDEQRQVYVINYDAIRGDSIFSALKLKDFKTVIADESTMLKERRTLRFKRLWSFCCHIPHRALLTGRVITERPEELFAQFLFLDGGETFGRSYWRFRFMYFDEPPPWKPYKWQLKRGAMEMIAKKFEASCVRVSEKIVSAQLPPKQYMRIHFDLSSEERAGYKQLKDEFALDFPEGGRYETQWVLARSAKMHQLASGFVYRELDEPLIYNTRKAEWISENLPEMLLRGPIVIWTSYLVHQVVIELELLAKGFSCSRLNGEMKQEERQQQLDAFLQGKTDILLIMEQLGAAALNLQRACNAVFADCAYSAAMRENAEHRTYRIGTAKTVFYYDLVTRRTLDEAVLNAIRDKREISDAILQHVRGVE